MVSRSSSVIVVFCSERCVFSWSGSSELQYSDFVDVNSAVYTVHITENVILWNEIDFNLNFLVKELVEMTISEM